MEVVWNLQYWLKMSSPSKRREMDVMKLMMSDYNVETINDGLNEFNVKFHGPKESLYEGGVWKIRVELPDAYPFKSPSIGFVNKIFHPNVDELSGSVCLDVINQSWSPMFNLLNIFEVFLPQLLLYPNPSDPLNGDAASLMMKDRKQYDQKVKENPWKSCSFTFEIYAFLGPEAFGSNPFSLKVGRNLASVCKLKMNRVSIRVLPILIFLLFNVSNSEDEEVKQSLVRFMDKLAGVTAKTDQSWGWNMTSDPCIHKWKGVSCDTQLQSVKKVVLDGLNLTGVLDIGSVCKASSLLVFSIVKNNVAGLISEEMGNCKRLTHLYLSGNRLSGHLPDSLKELSNLKRFDISNNNFSGKVPDLSRISKLITFYAQNNQLNEEIPKLDFSNLMQFNVSNNNFRVHFLIKKKLKEAKADFAKKGVNAYISSTYDVSKITEHKSENLASYEESKAAMSPLVVLRSPRAQGLRFEDLLRAPAELLGKGKHGSIYKVMLDNGSTTLAVKRVKDWSVTSQAFSRRMQRLHQTRHPNILRSLAFYSSKQEKLLVYEYQPNGSLSKLLNGSRNGQAFDWGSRINVAATVAEALAYMHEELSEDGIAHGNLKSANILFNNNMDPCVSEYGLMISHSENPSSNSHSNSFSLDPARIRTSFKADIYGFGVILLELVTGKPVQGDELELEWTVEVFDKGLLLEGASEERLLILLQIALKCINPNPYERPNMDQVAVMINTLKDEEEKSSSHV
ncbi:hypothetical protein GOBAR_AA19153 [Gossypium barbadense]|uniref:E2 ubiquitin-conjugating enzyme n=1 Tax=Gossypium barbadense TaxID=3634 RepID=A0A2P5XDU3_GOSBA|nr:hypothetical protein GOBAR_AA19153 [Gossypium barbadense]